MQLWNILRETKSCKMQDITEETFTPQESIKLKDLYNVYLFK